MVPSFEKRVRAFAIDTSGVALFSIIALGLSNVWMYLPYIVVGLAFFGLYFFPHFITPGQTFGKRIQKIKIVNLDGEDLKIWHALLRDLFKVVVSIFSGGIYLVISFFFMSEKTSRTIHDYLFKTKVIDLEKPTGKNTFMNKTESMRKRGF
jgi:uncharacterized RDD family membrane protein YckC